MIFVTGKASSAVGTTVKMSSMMLKMAKSPTSGVALRYIANKWNGIIRVTTWNLSGTVQNVYHRAKLTVRYNVWKGVFGVAQL